MINICFCFHDKTGSYAKFAGTAMLSLFENTDSEVTVHILHDNTLTPANREKFSYIANHYKQSITFYNLDELCPDKIAMIIKLIPEVETAKVTVGAFYKLLIPQVLPKEIDKAIFIDPDTIINLDISELWQIDLADKVLGVVPGTENGTDCRKSFRLCREGIVSSFDYFNTGVMLMNLDILRGEEQTIMQGIKFRGENPAHTFLEQTVLNYCFSKRTVKLRVRFNLYVKNARKYKDLDFSGKILHYIDGSSRMGLDMNDLANRLWMNYFIKTPWFNVEAFGRLYTNLKAIRNDLKDSALNLSTLVLGKTRVFFIAPEKLENVKQIFAIGDDEKIIIAEDKRSLHQLIATMKTSKGKSIVFVTTDKLQNKNFPFERLNKEGFTEGEDFIKAYEFLPDERNIPSASYALIEAM